MNYSVGDTVTYITFHGGVRTGVVTRKHDTAKSRPPGFDIRGTDGGRGFGYDDQIMDVKPA